VGKLNETFPLNDIKLNLDAFTSAFEADFPWQNLKLTMKFENAFGIPLGFDINTFKSTNSNTGQQVNLVTKGTPAGSLLVTQTNGIDYQASLTSSSLSTTQCTLIIKILTLRIFWPLPPIRF